MYKTIAMLRMYITFCTFVKLCKNVFKVYQANRFCFGFIAGFCLLIFNALSISEGGAVVQRVERWTRDQ